MKSIAIFFVVLFGATTVLASAQQLGNQLSIGVSRLDLVRGYWQTHSIPMNHPEQQTPKEALRSRFWDAHPTHGFIPKNFQNARPLTVGCPMNNQRLGSSYVPNTRTLTPDPLYTNCPPPDPTQAPPPLIPSGDCLSGASCFWNDYIGGGPSGRGGGCSSQDVSKICNVAVHPGRPSGPCDKDSAAVGDTVGIVGGQARTIVDINQIYQADGLPYSSGGTLTVNSHVWGWIYKDNANQFWVQVNPAYTWTQSFSASVNAWGVSYGFALNAPTGTAPKGPLAKSPTTPQGQKHQQCYTQGNQWN